MVVFALRSLWVSCCLVFILVAVNVQSKPSSSRPDQSNSAAAPSINIKINSPKQAGHHVTSVRNKVQKTISDDDVHEEQIPDTKETTEASIYAREREEHRKKQQKQLKQQQGAKLSYSNKPQKAAAQKSSKPHPAGVAAPNGRQTSNDVRQQHHVVAAAAPTINRKRRNVVSGGGKLIQVVGGGGKPKSAGKSRRRRQAILVEEPATEEDVEELAVLIKALQRLNQQSSNGINDDYQQQQELYLDDDGQDYGSDAALDDNSQDYGIETDGQGDDGQELDDEYGNVDDLDASADDAQAVPIVLADLVNSGEDPERSYYTRERRFQAADRPMTNAYYAGPPPNVDLGSSGYYTLELPESDDQLVDTDADGDYGTGSDDDDGQRMVYTSDVMVPGVNDGADVGDDEDVEVVMLPMDGSQMSPVDRAELQSRIDRMAVLLSNMRRRRK